MLTCFPRGPQVGSYLLFIPLFHPQFDASRFPNVSARMVNAMQVPCVGRELRPCVGRELRSAQALVCRSFVSNACLVEHVSCVQVVRYMQRCADRPAYQVCSDAQMCACMLPKETLGSLAPTALFPGHCRRGVTDA